MVSEPLGFGGNWEWSLSLKGYSKRLNKRLECYYQKWRQSFTLQLIWNLKATYAPSSDPRLRWLQYRLIMRILTTNRRLHIYGIRDSDNCEKCPGTRENISHLFWHLQYVQSFWMTLWERLRITERLCLMSIITGLCPLNETNWNVPIQLCISLAKQFNLEQ